MNEKAMVEWSETAQQLARTWLPSMRANSRRTRLDEDDIRDFLIDLWLKKGGVGAELEKANRGQLYNYVFVSVGNSRDALSSAYLISELRPAGRGEEETMDEDRVAFLSLSEHENGFDDESYQQEDDDEMAMLGGVGDAGASDGDDLDGAEKAKLREALDQRLEELAAIRDAGLSSALAEIFGTTDRTGRTFASDVRQEKMLALIVDAAKKRATKPAEVKKLAAEIAAERRKSIARVNAAGGDVSYSDIEAFEEMMGLVKPTTPTPTATKAKPRQKSVPAMPMVPQQQSIPMQLDLVARPSSPAGSPACRPPGLAR